jgi:hypothetical protein
MPAHRTLCADGAAQPQIHEWQLAPVELEAMHASADYVRAAVESVAT